MPKDEKFYFSHDHNARNDRKISALVKDYKSSGYGIYWCTVEMLHEDGGVLEFDELTISAISKDLNEDYSLVEDVLKQCISKYKLFLMIKNDNDTVLVANRVNRNLEKRKSISNSRSIAGKNGAIAKQIQANAKQTLPNDEQKEAKERKGKESKIKENKEKEISSASADKNFDFEEILNPASFPTWRAECSAFLKDDYFKKNYCKELKIPMGNLEKIMRDFIVEKNLNNDFKNLAGLKVHFGYWYKKHIKQTHHQTSKGFIEVPDNQDYDDMVKW